MEQTDRPAANYVTSRPSLASRLLSTHLLRALRYPNYRLFFFGNGVSLIGTWLTRLATSWLIYRLTGSAWMLGLVGFASLIPTFLLAPFAGVVVDRHNRHHLLVFTQVLAMLQSGALAALALSGVIQVWHVMALSVLQGVINAFDMPARQALLIDLVEHREDLPNAIALNSSLVNGARLIGPSVAGLLIALFGEGICFLIDSLSYLAVVAALLAMRLKPFVPRDPGTTLRHELLEGFRYAFGFPPIRATLTLLAIVSLMGISYSTLMPVFASEILHGGPKTLGLLTGATGVGAFAGALYLASRKTVVGIGKVIVGAGALFGLSLIAFAFSRSIPLALLSLAVVGFSMIAHFASGNTLLQTITDDEKRGRVMSFFGMAFMGMAPFGSLLTGFLADRFGPTSTVAFTGLCCFLASAYFSTQLPALRKLVHPIYVQKGILPQVATGLQSATETHARPEE